MDALSNLLLGFSVALTPINLFWCFVGVVLGTVVGPDVDITGVARGLTGDSGEIDLTPNAVTTWQAFDWSYSGSAQNLAYLTVKAGTAFAVVGIAGSTSGHVDVTSLLGGHDISHVSFWATNASQTEPVVAKILHGKNFLGNSRLAKISNGTVPCLHVETAEPARCVFTKTSGSWLESSKGGFAKAGQNISLDGKPGGEYVTASEVGLDGAVPCLAPTGHDAVGTPAGDEIAGACAIETLLSPSNSTWGQPLINYATTEVCATSNPHPDGAQLTRWYTNSAGTGIYCYTGPGAALNDINGTERDQYGYYYRSSDRCHVVWSNGYEVPAAKRPSTGGYPARVNPVSPIVWRTVDNRLRIAN